MTNSGKAFPDILAVDPTGCGCTECIIGEYVPQEIWEEKATAADLAAVLTGEVSNHTSQSLLYLVITNVFRTKSADEFQRVWIEEFDRAIGNINIDIDVDSIVERVSWMD